MLSKIEEYAKRERLTAIRLIVVEAYEHLSAFYEKHEYRPNGKTFPLPNEIVLEAFQNPGGLTASSKVVYAEMQKALA